MELFQDKKDRRDCTLDLGRGCEFCGCGGEDMSATVCEGCFKLHVTDWLKDYPGSLPGDIYEVRFKNTRRGYYQNVNNLPLKEGDIVAVEASPGHDIGIVSLSGDMVARQMHRVGFNPQNGEFRKIYRKAKPYDIEKWQEAIALEHETMIKARQIAAEMNLNMKIGDVEYQGDRIKAIFYYIADERVDFRELIKVFAEIFHIRVEMKQIGARQEAGRIGGIGSCGRELCCSSWIANFMSVTTNAARTQDISLNPQKLAGQCSKLKCCLIYEYDDYMDARREFPKVAEPLHVMDGDYFFVKNDILARTMSFSSVPGSMAGLTAIPIERVREIMRLNAKGVKPDTLEGAVAASRAEADPGFVNVIGEDSITRFDNNRGRKKKGRNGNNKERRSDKPQHQDSRPVRENVGKDNDASEDRSVAGRGDEGNTEAGGNGGNRQKRQGNDSKSSGRRQDSGDNRRADRRNFPKANGDNQRRTISENPAGSEQRQAGNAGPRDKTDKPGVAERRVDGERRVEGRRGSNNRSPRQGGVQGRQQRLAGQGTARDAENKKGE